MVLCHYVASVCKNSAVRKDNDFSNRQLFKSFIRDVEIEHTSNLWLVHVLVSMLLFLWRAKQIKKMLLKRRGRGGGGEYNTSTPPLDPSLLHIMEWPHRNDSEWNNCHVHTFTWPKLPEIRSVSMILSIEITSHGINAECTHSLRKLLTSFLFNVFTFCWLLKLLRLGVMASSTFSLLGKENDWEDFLRSRSELRGICKGGVVFNCSLAQPSLSSLSLLELFICFLDDLVFLLSSSESEDKRDLFRHRRFCVDKLGGSSPSTSSLDASILSWFTNCYPENRINIAGKLHFNIHVSTLHVS